MRELHLDPNDQSLSEDHRSFLKEAARNEGAPRVYYTYWTTALTDYTLMTTSKDIHLSFGRFTSEAINLFCRILNHAFLPESDSLLMITTKADGDNGRSGRGLLVTHVESKLRKRTFLFSTAGNSLS